MSFMMTTDTNIASQTPVVGSSSSQPMTMLPMTDNSIDPILADAMMTLMNAERQPSTSSSPAMMTANASDAQPVAMMMPSMTMTIQSEPGGGSAIELSTNMNPQTGNASSASGRLVARPKSPAAKLRQQQQQQQNRPQLQLIQQADNFDEPFEQTGGEQYYSSPWQSKSPLVSPAKLIRGERLKQLQSSQLEPSNHKVQPTRAPHAARLQQPPIAQFQLVEANNNNNKWRVASAREQSDGSNALEYEELIPIGPAQMMPVYQTPNGQLHLSPPPPASVGGRQHEREETVRGSSVELTGESPSSGERTTQRTPTELQSKGQMKAPTLALSSPAVKGKQSQQWSRKAAPAVGY